MSILQTLRSRLRKQKAVVVISTFIAFFSVYWLWTEISWEVLHLHVYRLRSPRFWFIVLMAHMFTGLGFAFNMLRLSVLSAMFDPERRLGHRESLRAVFFGFSGNLMFPLRLGEILKAMSLVHAACVHPSIGIVWIVMERTLDLLVSMSIVVLTLTLIVGVNDLGATWIRFSSLVGIVLVAVALLVFFPRLFITSLEKVLMVFPRRVAEFIRSWIEVALGALARMYRSHVRWKSVFLTIGYWICGLLALSCWVWVFDLNLPWYASAVMMSFLVGGTLVPTSIAYVGTYHLALAAALSFLGIPRDQGISLAVWIHALQIGPWLFVSAMFLMFNRTRVQ